MSNPVGGVRILGKAEELDGHHALINARGDQRARVHDRQSVRERAGAVGGNIKVASFTR